MELVAPSARHRASFLIADGESSAEGTGRGVTDDAGFAALLERFERFACGRDLPANRVQETTLWLVDGDEYLARISLRHVLTPDLTRTGGHVGFDVRPSRRREGHATRMLRLAIPRLAALGIDPALITCDDDNVGSRTVIESCGGTPAGDGIVVPGQRRYWLATRAAARPVSAS